MLTYLDSLHREREREFRDAQLRIAASRKAHLERSLRRNERRVARLETRLSKVRSATPQML